MTDAQLFLCLGCQKTTGEFEVNLKTPGGPCGLSFARVDFFPDPGPDTYIVIVMVSCVCCFGSSVARVGVSIIIV